MKPKRNPTVNETLKIPKWDPEETLNDSLKNQPKEASNEKFNENLHDMFNESIPKKNIEFYMRPNWNLTEILNETLYVSMKFSNNKRNRQRKHHKENP